MLELSLSGVLTSVLSPLGTFQSVHWNRVKNKILSMTKMNFIVFIMYNFVNASSMSQRKPNKFLSSN